MRYLGIDVGSSFIKGAVLDADALCLSHIERVDAPPLVRGLDPMFREIEPEAIVHCVRQVLERLHEPAGRGQSADCYCGCSSSRQAQRPLAPNLAVSGLTPFPAHN